MMLPVALLAACSPETGKVPAIDLTDLDQSVAPGKDFYLYANGGWMAKDPLTAEYARYGSFDVLRENNVTRLNNLFAEMSMLSPKPGTVAQKIVDLYMQGLDSTRLNTEGAEPIKKYLDQIYSAEDKPALTALLAEQNKYGEGGFFGIGVDADLTDCNTQILYMGQGGLGMGDRDYYTDPSNAELHEGYRKMLVRLFELCGNADPEKAAENAIGMEDKLAGVSWTKVQNRDINAIYNPMSTEQIATAFDGFDFVSFFEGLDIPAQKKIIVQQPSYFEGFSKIFAESGIEQIKDYLAGQFICSAANYLSDEFYAARFDFYSRQMSGITEHKPRWKRAMSVPSGLLGEAVGKLYVEKYFPESYKQQVLDLVHNLQESLGEHIDALDWMSDSTKAYAREKLAGFTVKIGYPDKWKDYSNLMVDPALSYYENLRAASAWHTADNLSKLGKPTDRTEWLMSPQTVNAYYNPATNEICFPAAILQPPFFNADADDAVNYGAIGVVIGHEMTHGFDDQGRLFDKDGNMQNWWTDEDVKAFEAKTAILKDQFDKIEILPGIYANGALSLGENIADQGGLNIAYTALQNTFGDKHPEPIDGFTAEQRFFLGYAHVWATNCTDEEKAHRTKTDVHSLPENRVNASLKNIQSFFDAFGIKEGDEMWRPENERVTIW